MADDPERLIAEALRAQAARTPLPEGESTAGAGSGSAEATQINAAPGLGLAGSGYGLLSGSDLVPPPPPPLPSPETVRVGGGQAATTRRLEPAGRLSVPAILLLAAALGLAAGAVAGLLTLL